MANFVPAQDYEQTRRPASGDTVVIMETTMGDIKIRLFPEQCPIACENFIGLVQKKFYNGITFHRVINGFMIQGGDPEGDGTGGHSIWGGTFEDEFSRNLFNFRGALSMANTGQPTTNGSQFFIVQASTSSYSATSLAAKGWPRWAADTYAKLGGTPALDGGFTNVTRYLGHTVFGQVYSGMDVVDKIAAVETGTNDRPLEPVTIKRAWAAKVQ